MVAALRAWVGAEANWALCGSAGISSRDTAVTFVGGNISFYDIKPRAPQLQDGAVPARPFAFQSLFGSFCLQKERSCLLLLLRRDQRLKRGQPVGFAGGFIRPQAVDAREAEGDAGFMAGRGLGGVEGDFEH